MKKTILLLILLSSCNSKNKEQSRNIDLKSYYQGYQFCEKQLKTLGEPYNLNQVLEGIKASARNENLPFTHEELELSISHLEEKKAEKNLSDAQNYLSKIAKDSEVIELVPSKLYFKLIENGSGDVIKENDPVLINYNAKIWQENQEKEIFSAKSVLVSLPDTIQGFAKGTAGMKMGEKRKLYIHPDLAYGSYGGKLDPNQLLIFEVEVLRKGDLD